jgi:UDPglucose 6-dehydrogenase
MKIAVVGMGHLAEATAECCAEWFELSAPPDADLVWFAVDTPVSEQDEPDVDYVIDELRQTLRDTGTSTPVLISSQLPVGTCAAVENEFPEHHLGVQPENVRKASAVADFRSQRRIVVGTRHAEDHELIRSVVSKFCPEPGDVLFMSPESAEMCKHVLNAYLALCIVFANEAAELCPKVGADVEDVFRAFRLDPRVGNGPLKPGGPYRGGTLGRDVVVLDGLKPGPLLSAIKQSNDRLL